MQPIWKDYFVSLGTGDSAAYTIRDNEGNIIYSGIAYRRPDDEEITIKVNDICANYLSQQLPTLTAEGYTVVDTLGNLFYVYDAAGTEVASVEFWYNWSYDYQWDNTMKVASMPINGVVDIRQPLLYTEFGAMVINITITLADGTQQTITYGGEESGDDVIVTSDGSTASVSEEEGETTTSSSAPPYLGNINLVLLLQNYPTAKTIKINDTDYTVADNTCANYVLFYVNANGGWDSLLIEGATVQTDNYTRHEYKQVYNNRQLSNRGTYNYLNEVKRNFKFNTSWLRDEQSERMHNLFGSTLVYMYNLTTMEIVPIVLTDSACEYKSYKQQGNQLVRYTINATVAQTMTRR